MRKRLASFLLATALAGCAPKHPSFVKVDSVALARVVVYRNGVAFYERRATVKGGELTVSVPRDRVDDFLKSLPVTDAKANTPLPASIPRQQADAGADLLMRLRPPAQGGGEAVLTELDDGEIRRPDGHPEDRYASRVAATPPPQPTPDSASARTYGGSVSGDSDGVGDERVAVSSTRPVRDAGKGGG